MNGNSNVDDNGNDNGNDDDGGEMGVGLRWLLGLDDDGGLHRRNNKRKGMLSFVWSFGMEKEN